MTPSRENAVTSRPKTAKRGYVCRHCGADIPRDRQRSAEFCSDACKQRAYRRRQLGEPENLNTRTFQLTAPIVRARRYRDRRNARLQNTVTPTPAGQRTTPRARRTKQPGARRDKGPAHR